MKKVTEKKKFRLKKSARLTIAGACAVTALVVAVIPTRGVQADDPFNPETMIPNTVDDAIAVDPFVSLNSNAYYSSVVPSDTDRYWAFPEGDTVTYEGHTYYTINRAGMFSDMTIPVFEIATQTSPTTTSRPQCIANYVGGDASGYTPDFGILKLSPAVIYTLDSDTPEPPYVKLEKGIEANHDPYTWTRYTETKIETPKTQRMIDVYGGDAASTPSAYYFEVKIEKWTRPWRTDDALQPGDPGYWIGPPDNPIDAGESPDGDPETFVACKHYEIVQSIANGAFKDVANFTEMELLSSSEGGGSAGITQIGDSAFENCTRLQSISLGENIQRIGTKAFYNCTGLTSIDFGVTKSIGDGAFADCTLLENIALPDTLEQLGTAAFMNCRSLNDSYVPNVYPDYGSEEDDKSNSGLFGGFPGINNNNFRVGSYAFCNCENLQNTKMCQTTQPITGTFGQYGMYAGCTNLKCIELPHNTVGFKATPSMFLSCPSLKCVRGNNVTDTCTDEQFINEVNESYFPGKEKNVSESFVIWGPNPNESGNIQMLKFAEANSLPYTYWDKYDNKFKYIMTLEDSYRFTFSDDFIVESITQLPGATAKTLRIPSKIGDFPIQTIADNACGKFVGSNYSSNLTLPTKIELPNTIASIGENAFRACKSVEEVIFFDAGEGSQIADMTSIGSNCFKDCSKLDVIKFRNDNSSGYGYFDINIDASSVGTDAFLTENPNGLQMYGRMEQGYWPYEYALDPANITCSSKADSYITYNSGNPQNLSCKYSRPDSSKPGYVSLLTYPTVNTVVGTKSVENPPGSGIFVDEPVMIEDLINAYYNGETLTPNQEAIINQFTRDVAVPYGITSIVNAKNDLGTETSPDTSDNDYFIRTNDYKTGHDYHLTNISFDSLESLPTVTGDENKVFSDCLGLQTITFNGNMKSLGILPFYNVPDDLVTSPLATLTAVNFNGENDKETATIDDPYYWYDNGIIYSYYVDADGNGVTRIEEVLQSRGAGVGSALINEENDPCLADITEIADDAFKNCDFITSVDFTSSTNLKSIPENCFYNCNQLKYVTLPENIREVQPAAFQENDNLKDITIYGKAINIDEDAFKNTESTVFHAYEDSSIPSYVKMVNKKEGRSKADELIYEELPDEPQYTLIFIDGNTYGEFYRETVPAGWNAALPTPPTHVNYEFLEWYSEIPNAWVNVQQNATIYAKYRPISTTSTTSTSTSSSTSTTSKSSSGGGGSSRSSSRSSSGSSSRSSSISGTTVQPIIVSGTGNPYGAGAVPAVNTATGSPNTGSGNAKTPNNVGKTKLISTTGGITDTSKMSATVNGSSDNYVIKITETQEANEMAEKALTAAFGSTDAIRYLPIDISLYDSTGTQKISPIPAGVSINITMPIPDNLAIYGGNAKIACTEGGVLDKIQPKFTVINGVPCMNYTVTHLSPYVVYVDTNNLTATGTLDATPKTGDPIHPKWFLVIGLAAVSGVMFLMRERKENKETAEAA